MYNTVIGVGAAVLIGGVALYTGYQMLGDREAPEAPRTEETGAARTGTAGGGRGVPDGERALDFADGAAGERIDGAGADEAAREAERLAALGAGGVAETDGEDAFGATPPGRRGLRGAVSETEDGGAGDDADAIASATGRVAPQDGADAPALAPTPVATAANPVQRDKPDAPTQFARLVDKPDNSPYFAATDAAPQFDPCLKADGTPYVGPGTAINPFSDSDPCLPKATGQAFEVASVYRQPGLATASDLTTARADILPFVDLVQPNLLLAPPVGNDFDFGSDYRF